MHGSLHLCTSAKWAFASADEITILVSAAIALTWIKRWETHPRHHQL